MTIFVLCVDIAFLTIITMMWSQKTLLNAVLKLILAIVVMMNLLAVGLLIAGKGS